MVVVPVLRGPVFRALGIEAERRGGDGTTVYGVVVPGFPERREAEERRQQ
ncbi:hypothetical protein [Streptomyces sp. NPDC058579]